MFRNSLCLQDDPGRGYLFHFGNPATNELVERRIPQLWNSGSRIATSWRSLSF
jgi:hypothetical protein